MASVSKDNHICTLEWVGALSVCVIVCGGMAGSGCGLQCVYVANGGRSWGRRLEVCVYISESTYISTISYHIMQDRGRLFDQEVTHIFWHIVSEAGYVTVRVFLLLLCACMAWKGRVRFVYMYVYICMYMCV